MEFDLVVKGGTVVTAEHTQRADVGVTQGVIRAVGDLSAAPAAHTVDADGLLVFPGGVDPHTHIKWPYLDTTSNDDFASASRAALHGGTTTVVDWALPHDQSAVEGVRTRIQQAIDDGVLTDFTLHAVLGPDLREGYGEVARLANDIGTPTFKCYLTYRRRGLLTDDGNLVRAMKAVRDAGGILGLHAENPAMHERTEEELRAAGNNDAIHFRMAKDNLVEAEAIHRAIYLAAQVGAAILIQHVSTSQGVEMIREAQGRGLPVFGEATPHYLVLTDEVYERDNGRLFLCSPPVKSAEDRDALWDGLADGTLSIVGADHCAFTVEQKTRHESAFDAPNGLPGIETRLPLVFSEGVSKARIDGRRFAAVTSTNAAKINGIYPKKGTIAVGSDADIVLIDPKKERVIAQDELHQGSDWTPYEGHRLVGVPVATILRGHPVIVDGQFSPPPTLGRFLNGEPGGYSKVRP